jgi:hypothetical protein
MNNNDVVYVVCHKYGDETFKLQQMHGPSNTVKNQI